MYQLVVWRDNMSTLSSLRVPDLLFITIIYAFLVHSCPTAGVRIFEMYGDEGQPRVLHGKTATIDGIYNHIGSFNLGIVFFFFSFTPYNFPAFLWSIATTLDNWSAEGNLEINMTTLDSAVAEDLERVVC